MFGGGGGGGGGDDGGGVGGGGDGVGPNINIHLTRHLVSPATVPMLPFPLECGLNVKLPPGLEISNSPQSPDNKSLLLSHLNFAIMASFAIDCPDEVFQTATVGT